MEGGEKNNSNISEYEIEIFKAKICSLKHFYELEIFYLGFGNVKMKTLTECCDEDVTYFYSNFKGLEYPKSGRKILNCNQELSNEELFRRENKQETEFNVPPFLLDNAYAVDAIIIFFSRI